MDAMGWSSANVTGDGQKAGNINHSATQGLE